MPVSVLDYINRRLWVLIAMPVCVLNDVGTAKHVLARSTKFETYLSTPWQGWDAGLEEIIDLYTQEGEFQAVALNQILWEMLSHFLQQSKAATDVLDGNMFVAVFAARQYVMERLNGYPIQDEVKSLFDAVDKAVSMCFDPPTDCVNILIQTGEENTSMKVFTTARFFMWFNENDLCENFVYNTALEFDEFEKTFIEQLPAKQKNELYPELCLGPLTAVPSPHSVSFF